MEISVLSTIEKTRLDISRGTAAEKKSRLGQFFTPASTARFMAALFQPGTDGECRLLDAGAGIGSLTHAFLERHQRGELGSGQAQVTAFEVDPSIHAALGETLRRLAISGTSNFSVMGGDFIESAVNHLQFGGPRFTHAILNPPYKKIASASHHRRLLRLVGIETVNLYSAFVALSLALLVPGGQLVAIIPRSFCNGPYYKPFREFILRNSAIRAIHLFDSRTKAFKDDAVLQENVILHLERDGDQGPVTVSISTDDSFSDLRQHRHEFNRIVFAGDTESFIHVPSDSEPTIIEKLNGIGHALVEVGVSVSTGPVVDFRLRDHLRDLPTDGTVPLLYAGHFNASGAEWPKPDLKKPNAIQRNEVTERWLYPNGWYCVVRRFSSKEERRRIVAHVVDPASFPNVERLGFENHLNVFHQCKQGIPVALAHGLAAYLNTSAVDEMFRRFNGHTQVNATDLRLMKYPSRETLIVLGERAIAHGGPSSQAFIDAELERIAA